VCDENKQDDPLLDYDQLSMLTGDINEESSNLVRELRDIFLQENEATLDLMRAHIESDDFAAIASKAHSLAGAGSNIGLFRLSKLCRRLESAAENGASDQCAALFKEIEVTYCQSIEALNGFMERSGEAS